MLNWSEHAHDYQKRAAAHLFERAAATLWLSPGYGKTTVTLHAFKALKDADIAQHMLIVAPLRVVQTVWAQEVENWATLNGLRTARLHGAKKETWLKRRDVNVWLINYEGLPWLSDMAKAGKIPFVFDVVVFDEIRRMKNSQGLRFKAVRPLAALAKYRWGLTGTPASNGLMDLFGQFLILDGGAALGQRVTRFRHDYFEQHYDGFTWVPRPGAQEAIEKKIEPYIFRADGKLDLPDFVFDNRTITLDTKARKTYTTLKNDLIASIGDVTITAANAAVLMGKLKQMANGRVYDENRKVIEIHSAKKDALLELVEELGDEQLLIAYEYNHDLAQIREALGDDLPYLGAGVNEKTAMDYVARWNSRDIKIMAAHPASAGHGLNLQKGGAHHILWWGPTFDLDHYIQFNDRLRRQGNEADAVVVHTFITEKSVDETAVKAREEKDTLQTALLNALTAEFGESIKVNIETENHTMQLQFKSDAALAPQPAAANPFAVNTQGAQPTNNPFAQPAQQPAQAAANPFANAAPPQANPFAATGQNTGQPPANPFATGGVTQAQAIQNDVAAPPAATPQPHANPFASFGSAPVEAQPAQVAHPPMGNPFARPAQPVEDAVVVQSAPNPFANVPPASDTGWQTPQTSAAPGTEARSTVTEVVQAGGDGLYVPFSTMIPAGKLAAVLAAIARAVK
jgi:hypothetical protein